MRGLSGRVAIIAGAGAIGSATAKRLAAEGARVVIGDMFVTSAEATAAEIVAAGGYAVGVAFDMTDELSIAALVATATNHYGGLDIMHVNAADMVAGVHDTDALAIPLDVFDRTIEVNLRGHLLCTRHALPAMLARGSGALIYTSSAGAFRGEAERIAYAISKSGLHALVRHVASRWGKDNIRSNAVAPGFVATEQLLAKVPAELQAEWLACTPSPRLSSPDDIASMVVMLASDDGRSVNGQVISVDGGLTMR